MSTQETTLKEEQYTLFPILGIWLVGKAPLWIFGQLVHQA